GRRGRRGGPGEAPGAPIVAAARSPRALAMAARNAERAGVAAAIRFAACEFAALAPPAATGLVALDPPYGRRLASRSTARAGYAALAAALRERWSGWRAAVLAPERELVRGFPGREGARHALRPGGPRRRAWGVES